MESSEKWKSEIKLPCTRCFSAPYSSVHYSKLQGRPRCGARKLRYPASRPQRHHARVPLALDRGGVRGVVMPLAIYTHTIIPRSGFCTKQRNVEVHQGKALALA